MRIGFGYDSHRFADVEDDGQPAVQKLGGVPIPDCPKLVGHSDADVLIHAIIDALLGAAALGDIGSHFPSDDPRWENANSAVLLCSVMKEIADAYDYPYKSHHSRYPLYRFVEDFPSVPESDSAQLIMEIEAGLWMFRSTPSLILWAMRDWLYTPRQLKWWQRYLPGAEVHKLERAGRYIQEDAGEELIRYIRNFFIQHQI